MTCLENKHIQVHYERRRQGCEKTTLQAQNKTEIWRIANLKIWKKNTQICLQPVLKLFPIWQFF